MTLSLSPILIHMKFVNMFMRFLHHVYKEVVNIPHYGEVYSGHFSAYLFNIRKNEFKLNAVLG
jgi:hypothetical protein